MQPQGVECWHDGIGKQQRVTAQELPLSEHGPPREEPGEDPRLTALPRGGYQLVNGGARFGTRFFFHDFAAPQWSLRGATIAAAAYGSYRADAPLVARLAVDRNDRRLGKEIELGRARPGVSTHRAPHDEVSGL